MRVLITTGIFPPDIGGPARIIERLVVDLHKRGLEVTVLTYGWQDNERYSFPVVRENNKMLFAWQLWRLAGQADIIYTLDLYTPGLLSWFVGKFLRRKKLIVRFAGDSAWEKAWNRHETEDDIISFQDNQYGWRIGWEKKLRKKILVGSDKVVAVSGFMKDLAIKIGVSDKKVEVVYNSVDFVEVAAVHQTNRREQLSLKKDEKVIMTAGRLVPWKGVDGLIVATEKLKNDWLPVKLVVLGEGPDRNRLESLIEQKEVQKDVILVGRVNMDEMSGYYQAADVFVLNSQYEGLSHVLLEVLRIGKPIVASNCGGNPEVIEDGKNGLLVEYNDVERLAAAIKRLLVEEKWHTVEYQEICRVSLVKFNWELNLEKTIKVFQETLVQNHV